MIRSIEFYSRPRFGLQSTNPMASLSKYPAKAIEGSLLNWKIYLDDSIDDVGMICLRSIGQLEDKHVKLVIELTCIIVKSDIQNIAQKYSKRKTRR
jgi:hypothetical protein